MSSDELSPGDERKPLRAATSLVPGARRYLMKIAYDGTNYFGWQRQPDQPTVQQTLEEALAALLEERKVPVSASSRTDTGVHALAQSATFCTHKWPATPDRIPYAINTRLPNDIVVREAVEVPMHFHPLRESNGKRYRYQIYCARKADPIGARTHWWVRKHLCLDAMQEAARFFVGEKDFCSFQSTGSPRESTIRHVRELTVTAQQHMDGSLISIEIEANGFLYNMVRNIVGTLVQIGVGREPPKWVEQIFAAQDRQVAGATAPPQGLFLTEVLYPSDSPACTAETSMNPA